MDKLIGKIKCAYVGMGGYQNSEIGVSFVLCGSNETWGVNDFRGYWSDAPSSNSRWKNEDRIKYLGGVFLYINEILTLSKKTSVNDLAGTPVEVYFDENRRLVSWRVLTEAI